MSAIDFPPEDNRGPIEQPSEPIPAVNNTETNTYQPDQIDTSSFESEFDGDSLFGLLSKHAATRSELCLQLHEYREDQTIKQQNSVTLAACATINALTDEMRCLLGKLLDKDDARSIDTISRLYYEDMQATQGAAHDVSGAIDKNLSMSFEALSLNIKEALKIHLEESSEFVEQRLADDLCSAYRSSLVTLVDAVSDNIGHKDSDAKESESIPVSQLRKIGKELIRATASAITIAAGVAIGSIIADRFKGK